MRPCFYMRFCIKLIWLHRLYRWRWWRKLSVSITIHLNGSFLAGMWIQKYVILASVCHFVCSMHQMVSFINLKKKKSMNGEETHFKARMQKHVETRRIMVNVSEVTSSSFHRHQQLVVIISQSTFITPFSHTVINTNRLNECWPSLFPSESVSHVTPIRSLWYIPNKGGCKGHISLKWETMKYDHWLLRGDSSLEALINPQRAFSQAGLL